MRKIVIAVSGVPGAGKTTYARFIAKEYNLRYVSNGQLFRQYAKEKGLTLIELHKMAEKDPSIDLMIDRRTLEEAMKGNVVVEGHLVPWIVKDIADVKIYVKAPLTVRVKRIAKREKRPIDEVLRETVIREYSQRVRFLYFYGIDIVDLSIYDLVIDTSYLKVDEVIQIIEKFIETRITELRNRVMNE